MDLRRIRDILSRLPMSSAKLGKCVRAAFCHTAELDHVGGVNFENSRHRHKMVMKRWRAASRGRLPRGQRRYRHNRMILARQIRLAAIAGATGRKPSRSAVCGSRPAYRQDVQRPRQAAAEGDERAGAKPASSAVPYALFALKIGDLGRWCCSRPMSRLKPNAS